MKLVIATEEGAHVFDQMLGTIEGLTIVKANTPEEALTEIADADVYYGRPSDELVRAAKKLKLLQAQSAGVDFLMTMPEVKATPIPLANTRGAHATSIAEHTFSLLLALTRGLPICFEWQREKRWERGLEIYRMPKEISGSTMGIVGYGAIGKEIAARAVAFGMRVLAVDAFPAANAPHVSEVWPVSRLHEMLGQSEVVSVAAPLTAETRHIMDAAAFAAMKPGGYLIAVSRGGIVDETALAEALASKHLAGAGMDVFETEPLSPESPLWLMPNVVITPHLAGSSYQKEARCVGILRENILRLQRGEPFVNLVDKERGF